MTAFYAGSAAAAAIVLAATFGQFVAAADGPTPARVHFAGCVKPGVEHSCLIIESGGKTYNVTSGKGLKVGQFAAGTGVPGGMSYCQQGEVLTDIVLDTPQPQHAECPK